MVVSVETSAANVDFLRFGEQPSSDTPAAGFAIAYFKTDGLLYTKDDAGLETGPITIAANVILNPASDVRNIIEPSADFIPLTVRGSVAAQTKQIFVAQEGSADTEVFSLSGTGGALFQNFTDSTTGFQIFDKDGGTPIFNVDTTNEFIGIGIDSPTSTLHVSGTSLLATKTDQTTLEVAGNTDGVVGTSVLKVSNGNGWDVLSIQRRGWTTFSIPVDGTSTFAIWSSGGSEPVFNVDTTNERIGVGTDTPATTLDVVGIGSFSDKVIANLGVQTIGNEWGDSLLSWKYGDGVPEHSETGTGNYDAEGGANSRLFTCASSIFTQADEDNRNWIIIRSGTHTNATAEIESYIDTDNVTLSTQTWDSDLSNVDFDVVKHPQMIVNDGYETDVFVNTQGHFSVHTAEGFVGGTRDERLCPFELEVDAGSDNVIGMCVIHDANGYSSNSAVALELISGDLDVGDTQVGYIININDVDAVSADATTEIDGIIFNTIDVSDAAKHAIHVNPGFESALTVAGAEAADPDYGWEVASTTVIDRVNSAGAGDDAFVNPAVDQIIMDSVNDYILIGNDNTFEIISCVFATPSSKDNEFEFYYSKAGGNWTALIPIDGTVGFSQSGLIAFSAPGDWTKDDEAEVNGDITDAYYIKIERTRVGDPSTIPIESYFKIFADKETGMKIRGNGTIQPVTMVDVSAQNDSIYFSTDQSKLVYKDTGGTVHVLY